MASGSSATSVVGQNAFTFGVLPPPTKFLPRPVEVIASKAASLGILGDLRASFIQEDAIFTRAVCSVGPALAAENGIAVPNTTVATVSAAPTVEEVKAVYNYWHVRSIVFALLEKMIM